MYNDMLDDCFEPFMLGTLYYSPSDVFQKVGPVAYRVGYADWLDAQLSDGILFEHSDGSIHDTEEEKKE